MSSFTRWLSALFGREKAEEIESGDSGSRPAAVLELERVAIQTATGYLAAAVAQSDFRTFMDKKEIREAEYYLWNIAPNANQSSTQFLQDLVDTLVYNNEALIVDRAGQLFIADGYVREEQGCRMDRFTGITIRGEPFPDRDAAHVIYLRMHNEDIRPLLSDLCHQYETIIREAMEGYEKTNADKGILNIDTAKTGPLGKDYEKIRKDLLNNRFKDFFSTKNAVLPLYAGFEYTPHNRSVRNTSEITDIKTLSDEVYNRVGQAFRIPPSLLRGEVANNEAADARFFQLGVRPICNMLSEEITRKRYGRAAFEKGSYLMVDPSNVELGGVFAAAAKIDKLISCGVFSVDEVRNKLGEPLLGTEWAQEHHMTKNYEKMSGGGDGAGKGGEEKGEGSRE